MIEHLKLSLFYHNLKDKKNCLIAGFGSFMENNAIEIKAFVKIKNASLIIVKY